LGGRNKLRESCEQTRQLIQISLIRSIGRITRQPSSNGSPGSPHKSRKDVQSQICLPAELFDIGSSQDFAGRGGARTADLATEFLNARTKMCHLFFCSFQLFNGSRFFLDRHENQETMGYSNQLLTMFKSEKRGTSLQIFLTIGVGSALRAKKALGQPVTETMPVTGVQKMGCASLRTWPPNLHGATAQT
jgi:hypothetical protein